MLKYHQKCEEKPKRHACYLCYILFGHLNVPKFYQNKLIEVITSFKMTIDSHSKTKERNPSNPF